MIAIEPAQKKKMLRRTGYKLGTFASIDIRLRLGSKEGGLSRFLRRNEEEAPNKTATKRGSWFQKDRIKGVDSFLGRGC